MTNSITELRNQIKLLTDRLNNYEKENQINDIQIAFKVVHDYETSGGDYIGKLKADQRNEFYEKALKMGYKASPDTIRSAWTHRKNWLKMLDRSDEEWNV